MLKYPYDRLQENTTIVCGKSAEKEKIMKSAAMINMLEEIKALHNQNELSEADSERWDFLCKSVDNGYFRDTLLEYLNDDQELTVQILDYLKKTGNNIEQLVFGGVAVGMYLLEKLHPTDCGYDHFGEFWLECCYLQNDAVCSIDNAINRAIDRMLDEKMS